MARKKDAPAIAKMKIEANPSFVGDALKELLSKVREMAVIELDGSLGNVSEYLSHLNKNVRLCEEGRLYFVYRRQLWPKSTVVEMNINPEVLNNSKPYYDCVIIHDESKRAIAEKLSKRLIINVGDLTITDKQEEETVNEGNQKGKLSTDVDIAVSENVVVKDWLELPGDINGNLFDGVFPETDGNQPADISSDSP